ncbi:MAG TPA: class I SAM-dependent rRNA methyltransferase [Candidatus Hydrogenedentes bacterium]|nr:class I SAM-dependent rRNA methyltransferase [Candidatus Hydrogenedentota bacterium]HQB02936.1 class I SAM-dependent rRNA methyltransferase [Candidatus Hydrogenedentota bacterium]
MSASAIPTATLKAREERRIQRGHLWCYRNEFMSLPDLEDGDVFDVYSSGRRFVARAFYQAEGGICGRVLSYHQTEINRSFWKKCLQDALVLREHLFPRSVVYRWIHAESDGLPGLVADRYDSVVVLQSGCAFYRRHWQSLQEILLAVPGVSSLTFAFREERLEAGAAPEKQVLELNGLRLGFLPAGAQKTGLFLDQRENWQLAERFAPGARVLDGCCYHGLWGLHAARGGALSVTGVDSSAAALAQAEENAGMNAFEDRFTFIKEKVEKHLQECTDYDLIVLDPPAFAKSRKQQNAAFALYENLNSSAMQKLTPGGILISCSCSHFLDGALFDEMLKRAARSTARQVQLLMMRGASPDHPVLTAMPETSYLKCAVLRVL